MLRTPAPLIGALGVWEPAEMAMKEFTDEELYKHRAEAEEMYKRGSYDKAYSVYMMLADAGDHSSQRFVGWMSLVGRGTHTDLEVATKWLQHALDAGDHHAEYLLGHVALAQGRKSEAARRFNLASAQGVAGSSLALARMYAVGNGVEKNLSRALALYKAAEAEGDIYARVERARILLEESNGFIEASHAQIRLIVGYARAIIAFARDPYKWDRGVAPRPMAEIRRSDRKSEQEPDA